MRPQVDREIESGPEQTGELDNPLSDVSAAAMNERLLVVQ